MLHPPFRIVAGIVIAIDSRMLTFIPRFTAMTGYFGMPVVIAILVSSQSALIAGIV